MLDAGGLAFPVARRRTTKKSRIAAAAHWLLRVVPPLGTCWKRLTTENTVMPARFGADIDGGPRGRGPRGRRGRGEGAWSRSERSVPFLSLLSLPTRPWSCLVENPVLLSTDPFLCVDMLHSYSQSPPLSLPLGKV